MPEPNMAEYTVPIPFSEPPWLQGLPSPIFKPTHYKWQRTIRAFISEHLHSHAIEWEKEGTVPPHVFETFAKHNMLIPALPAPLPVEWLHKVGIRELPGGLKVEDYDYLHALVFADEMARSGLAGPSGSLTTGVAFGVPPIIKFGSRELQERFLPELLLGKKRSCIAITEPDAGSDVAGITTTATKSRDGKHWIVNGTKKWITNGIWTDYASMAVRTGGEGSGAKGLSMLVVPLKGHPGVSMRRLKVGGQISAGTTYIELDDVKVPVDNLIGEEGKVSARLFYFSLPPFPSGRRRIGVPTCSRWTFTDDATEGHAIHHDELQPRATDHRGRHNPLSPSGLVGGIRVCPETGGLWQALDGSAGGSAQARQGRCAARIAVGMGGTVCLSAHPDEEGGK